MSQHGKVWKLSEAGWQSKKTDKCILRCALRCAQTEMVERKEGMKVNFQQAASIK